MTVTHNAKPTMFEQYHSEQGIDMASIWLLETQDPATLTRKREVVAKKVKELNGQRERLLFLFSLGLYAESLSVGNKLYGAGLIRTEDIFLRNVILL